MIKTVVFFFACFCILIPNAARADDGGFWDMLFHWDTKFSGYGTEIHLVCVDKAHNRIDRCEEWFTKLLHIGEIFHKDPHSLDHGFDFDAITHEVSLRV